MSVSIEQGKSLLVIGGADGMPNWLVRRVYGRSSAVERITLLDVRPVDEIPNSRWVSEFNLLPKPVDAMQVDYENPDGLVSAWRPVVTSATPPESQLPLSQYDLVMLGVPADQLSVAARNIFPQLGEASWIIDVCSVKQEPVETMLKHAPRGASVIGTHPLFGPALPDLVGQTMILAKTALTSNDHLKWLTNLYRERGALIVQASPKEHDFYMRHIQGLTHFAYLVFGETLRRATNSGFDLARSFQFATPPYDALVAFLSRIAAADPRVYAQIQADPSIVPMRDLMVASARSLAERFLGSDEPTIMAEISSLGSSFHERAVATGVSLARSYVESAQSYFRLLQERKTSGGLTVVQVVDPLDSKRERSYRAGKLIDYDSETLLLDERISYSDGKLIVVYDERSLRGAKRLLRRLGIGLPKDQLVRIQHKRARMLSDVEIESWRRVYLLHHELVIPFVAGNTLQLRARIEGIPLICQDVVSAELRQPNGADWLSHYGLINRIAHVTIFGDRVVEEAQRCVVQQLREFGFHIHQEFDS